MGRIDIVLPAHNEGPAIHDTLREFHQAVAGRGGFDIRFVVCEDGSTDDTVEVLRRAAQELPLLLLTAPERKGYSRAVVDGLRATDTEWVGFIDSDGQCDPADFASLAARRSQADLVIGYRNPRSDHWVRLAMSGAFGVVYRLLFSIPVKDPSCPYLLVRREALQKILAGDVGVLKQGFWWEFLARAFANGVRVEEVPVRHRPRASGTTQVYRPTKIPRIATEHLLALFKLRRELAARTAR
jgi:glycosyltransferase involved in cell wall biosynthesis